MKLETAVDNIKAYAADSRFGWLMPFIFYFIGGFIGGLLCRIFGRFVLWFTLVACVVILLLQYMGIIALNIDTIKDVIGLDSQITIASLVEFGWLWIQRHIVHSIAALIGFIIAFEFL